MAKNKQLLYLWINNDESGCFKDTEFNFNPKFRFHFDKAECVLRLKKVSSQINIFDNNNICNLTAIIGNNGAGKSTLLKRLYDLPFNPIKKVHTRKDKKYKSYSNHFMENSFYLCALLIDDQIRIINNYKKPIVYGSERIDVFDKNVSDEGFDDITRVFLSFSFDEYETSHFFENHNKYFISPKAIAFDNAKYIEKLELVFKNNPLKNLILDVFKSSFSLENTLTAYAVVSEDKYKPKTIDEKIKFKITNLHSALYFGDDSIGNYELDSLFQAISPVSEMMSYITKNNYLDYVKYQMILEYCSFGFFTFENKVKPKTHFEDVWAMICEDIEMLDKTRFGAVKRYFLNAIDEIELFCSLDIDYTDNLLPLDDIARHIKAVLDKNNGKKLLDKILINNEVPSFLSKYLDFNLGMSAGELASIRLFGYLSYIFKYKESGDRRNEYPMHNVLIMFDEPDISLHPQAKIHFISQLISLVRDYFSEHNVQIIITSHSPIILSDIPHGNIVYLKRDAREKTKVFNSSRRTFGSPISSLYTDSFYFDDVLPIGNFARETINALYAGIQNNENIQDKNIELINLIGDDLIRNQFYRIAPKTKHENSNNEKASEQLKEIEKQLQLLRRAIRKMNDK